MPCVLHHCRVWECGLPCVPCMHGLGDRHTGLAASVKRCALQTIPPMPCATVLKLACPGVQYFADVSQPYKTPVAGARGRSNAFEVDVGSGRAPSPIPGSGRPPFARARTLSHARPQTLTLT